jgi:NAD(P)H dehydrogenase (quinone)
MTMVNRKYLVTGATGATGSAVVKILLDKGKEVRALVHSEDRRAQALRELGANVIKGDLLDFESMRAALEGIYSAYFVYPIVPGILQATAYFAQAAKEVELIAIVNMSQISARRAAKSHAAQDHWLAERVFDWSGVPVTHLRPTFFAEWSLRWAASYQSGTLRLPFGTGRHAPVAAVDQARVIANILVSPEEHKGKIYPLYGEKEFSFAEITAEVGRVLGKQIDYEKTDVATLSKSQRTQLGDFFWQHLTEVVRDHQDGLFAGTNDVIERIGGQPPLGLHDFLQAHKEELEGRVADAEPSAAPLALHGV